ncbi:MAG: peptide chain release factor N(5)-glutamine methyltransferase [Bacteroidota bacterium]|nr:peptide chain release factor N(5)-glutamine methyltransferase [Bacteroidota bacterium]
MTTEKAYIDFVKSLKTIYDKREADNIADWIFEKITGSKRLERRFKRNNELKESEIWQLQNYLKELLQHKPVQYVLQEAWFYKMKFFVNGNVLIPRPETEELVEWIINDASKPTNIIDIGTGSGCIGIALKKELPRANVTAIDRSEKALEVAKINSIELNAEINFLQINFLKEEEWKSLQKYDLIVSNPPYIPIKEKEKLAKNVTEYEPGLALFVENNDPYIFYKKIAEFSKTHLKSNGKIYVEVHEDFAKEVKTIFVNAGFEVEIKKDIYGKERMIKVF